MLQEDCCCPSDDALTRCESRTSRFPKSIWPVPEGRLSDLALKHLTSITSFAFFIISYLKRYLALSEFPSHPVRCSALHMGWIQANRKAQLGSFNLNAIKTEVSHIENAELQSSSTSAHNKSSTAAPKYPYHPADTTNSALPFIPADEITSKRRPGMVARGDTANEPTRQDWWIVVDNIVYDVTDFILEHPGGEQVIMSFLGEDCSWQFWRFHSKSLMQEYGVPLRIGRTEGVKNRFAEPKRFVGLRRLGRDEW